MKNQTIVSILDHQQGHNLVCFQFLPNLKYEFTAGTAPCKLNPAILGEITL